MYEKHRDHFNKSFNSLVKAFPESLKTLFVTTPPLWLLPVTPAGVRVCFFVIFSLLFEWDVLGVFWFCLSVSSINQPTCLTSSHLRFTTRILHRQLFSTGSLCHSRFVYLPSFQLYYWFSLPASLTCLSVCFPGFLDVRFTPVLLVTGNTCLPTLALSVYKAHQPALIPLDTFPDSSTKTPVSLHLTLPVIPLK